MFSAEVGEMIRSNVVIHTTLTPNEVGDALLDALKPGNLASLTPSRLLKECPLVGEVGEETFWIRRKGFSGPSAAADFYGEFFAEPSGTEIRGRFDFPQWVRTFLWRWRLAVIVMIVGALLKTLDGSFAAHSFRSWKELMTWILLGAVMILWPSVLRWYGGWPGRANRLLVLDRLQEILKGKVELKSSNQKVIGMRQADLLD